MASRREDYILRMIEELRLFIAQVITLRGAGRYDEALIAIINAQERLFGMPAQQVLATDPASQFELLTKGESAEIGRPKCLALANLLAETAHVYTDKGQAALAVGAWRFAIEILERAHTRFGDNESGEVVRKLAEARSAAGESA